VVARATRGRKAMFAEGKGVDIALSIILNEKVTLIAYVGVRPRRGIELALHLRNSLDLYPIKEVFVVS
jgi:hypothetical protein